MAWQRGQDHDGLLEGFGEMITWPVIPNGCVSIELTSGELGPSEGDTFVADPFTVTRWPPETHTVKDCYGGYAHGLELCPGPRGFYVHAEDGSSWSLRWANGTWIGRQQ